MNTSPLILLAVIIVSLAAVSQISLAQTSQLTSALGEVKELDKQAKIVNIRTDQGGSLVLKTNDTTVLLRVPAGAQSLEQASSITFDDINVGDRVLARGNKGDADFSALRIVVLTKADIAKRRELDLEEWRKRGVAGIVKTINPESNLIDVELRGGGPTSLLSVDASKAEFRRYTTSAISFEGAKPGEISDLVIGDQLRALGDKDPAGNTFKAEAIVSGSFKTIGATITSVDTQTGKIKATTLDQRTPILISTLKESSVRRIPANLAPAIAQKAAPRPTTPAGGPTAQSQQGPRPNPSAEIQQMIDSLPSLPVSDLKVGDVVSVTGVKEQNEAKMTAIKLVAGVDAVLRALQTPGRPQVVRLSAGLPNAFDFSVIP